MVCLPRVQATVSAKWYVLLTLAWSLFVEIPPNAGLMSLVKNNGIPEKTELLNRDIPIWLRVAGSVARTCCVIRLKPMRASLTTFGVTVYVQLKAARRLSTGVVWLLSFLMVRPPPRGSAVLELAKKNRSEIRCLMHMFLSTLALN